MMRSHLHVTSEIRTHYGLFLKQRSGLMTMLPSAALQSKPAGGQNIGIDLLDKSIGFQYAS